MGKLNILKIGNVNGVSGENLNQQYHQLMPQHHHHHHHAHGQAFRINPALFAVAANSPNTIALHTNLIPKSILQQQTSYYQTTQSNLQSQTRNLTETGNKIRLVPSSSNSTSPHSSTSIESPSQSPQLNANSPATSSAEISPKKTEPLETINESINSTGQNESVTLNELEANKSNEMNTDDPLQTDASKVKFYLSHICFRSQSHFHNRHSKLGLFLVKLF